MGVEYSFLSLTRRNTSNTMEPAMVALPPLASLQQTLAQYRREHPVWERISGSLLAQGVRAQSPPHVQCVLDFMRLYAPASAAAAAAAPTNLFTSHELLLEAMLPMDDTANVTTIGTSHVINDLLWSVADEATRVALIAAFPSNLFRVKRLSCLRWWLRRVPANAPAGFFGSMLAWSVRNFLLVGYTIVDGVGFFEAVISVLLAAGATSTRHCHNADVDDVLLHMALQIPCLSEAKYARLVELFLPRFSLPSFDHIWAYGQDLRRESDATDVHHVLAMTPIL